MDGIYLRGAPSGMRRPKSKKEIRDACAADPSRVLVEATSMHGTRNDEFVSKLPDGTYPFVGPDPYTRRVFYGSIVKRAGRVMVK